MLMAKFLIPVTFINWSSVTPWVTVSRLDINHSDSVLGSPGLCHYLTIEKEQYFLKAQARPSSDVNEHKRSKVNRALTFPSAPRQLSKWWSSVFPLRFLFFAHLFLCSLQLNQRYLDTWSSWKAAVGLLHLNTRMHWLYNRWKIWGCSSFALPLI